MLTAEVTSTAELAGVLAAILFAVVMIGVAWCGARKTGG